MSGDKTIQVLQGGSALAEWGPMRLVISAFVGRIPQPQMCVRAAEKSFLFLESVARSRSLLYKNHREVQKGIKEPVVLEMIESVRVVGDEDLTPMAAVAGAISDAVADFLADRGMTKVVVDNGGDIAVRLHGSDPAIIGIRPEVHDQAICHVVALHPYRSSWGVATSGLGGRSLTRGVATAANIIASKASVADAAATAVANASYIEDEQVIQRPAHEIDPYTDIPGLRVTIKVGLLSEEKRALALTQSIQRAEELIKRKVILGAFVAVQGKIAMTTFFEELLAEQ